MVALKEKIEMLRSGKLSPSENVKGFLEAIKKGNKKINAFIDIREELALKEADFIGKNKKKFMDKPLYGLCFGIKANINVKYYEISCASKTLEGHYGAYDADVVKKIFKWYFDNWQRRKAKAGIKARIIYSAKLKGKRPMAVQKLTKVKFSPERFEFPSTVIAFGNKVAIITWEPNPTGFLLESKETAKTFLNYFELLWKAARK